MKKKLFIFIFICVLVGFTSEVHAEYVLPYPSVMPGNKMYKITRVIDKLKNFWYFGNIAQIKYHLGLSDKYLVEAKTLMEYKQYLLASDALQRSDSEFSGIVRSLRRAKAEKKDIIVLQKNIKEAAGKHAEVLSALLLLVPPEFMWTPEKGTPTELKLNYLITGSVNIRASVSAQISSL